MPSKHYLHISGNALVSPSEYRKKISKRTIYHHNLCKAAALLHPHQPVVFFLVELVFDIRGVGQLRGNSVEENGKQFPQLRPLVTVMQYPAERG